MSKSKINIILTILILVFLSILIILIVTNKPTNFNRLIEEDEITLRKDKIEVYDEVLLSDILVVKDNYL